MSPEAVIHAIDNSPLNRGLSGAAWMADPANKHFACNGDVVLFDGEGEGTYQVHLLFQAKGRAAVEFITEAFRQMFEDHQAELIFGMVPDFRRDVKIMSRWVGGKFAGKRDTPEGPCELYVLSKEMWSALK